MIGAPTLDLPPLAQERLSVCIPARDEAATIAITLAALAAQRDTDGRALPPRLFDVVVFANNCTDGTARVVRAAADGMPHLEVTLVEDCAPAAHAHIGVARKRLLDAVAARALHAGRPEHVIASLDADTLVAPDWIAWMLREIAGRDAVGGFITLAPDDRERLVAPVRLLYARELAYRRTLAELEAALDPRPEDPPPRHGSFVGASFGVTAAMYAAAGGLPPRRRLEDVAFARALDRIDARVRHSLQVRAWTSARRDARVAGGFGTFLADLDACAFAGRSFLVEDPRRTLDDLRLRGRLRRARAEGTLSAVLREAAIAIGAPSVARLTEADPALPIGALAERIIDAPDRPPAPPVFVDEALEVLSAANASCRLAGSAPLATSA